MRAEQEVGKAGSGEHQGGKGGSSDGHLSCRGPDRGLRLDRPLPMCQWIVLRYSSGLPDEAGLPSMPQGSDSPSCQAVTPSAASELGWIVEMLLATAPYAEPALADLDDALRPGITDLHDRTRERSGPLWAHGMASCASLLPLR